MRRTLTVILASDVAGYSRLVAANEEEAIHRFREAATMFTDLVKKYQGTVFNTAGDAILARFDSAVDATRCAIDIQDANNANNALRVEEERLLFRIGIAIGDVLVAENGDLLGDAVNIAARLENVAEPGGICISDDVHAQVLNKIRLNVIDLGDQNLRNISRAVRVFKLVSKGGPGQRFRRRVVLRIPLVWGLSGAGVAGVLGLAALAWTFNPWAPDVVVSEPFDPQKVPLVNDRVRETLASYEQEPEYKALAISSIGWGVSYGAKDVDSAKRESMERCQRRDKKGYCRIYAVSDRVVMSKTPLPLPVDMRTAPLETNITADDISWVGRGAPKIIEAYFKHPDHKAIALAANGYYHTGNRRSAAEAARLATERCSDRQQAPCLLMSVDGFLTVRPPRTHTITQLFMLTTETDMTDADKARIGDIYFGKEWRALARGRNKKWHAVSGMQSEEAAVEEVLKLCRNEDHLCTVHAISNFRVGARKKTAPAP